MTGQLAHLGHVAGWRMVRALPEGVARPAFRVVADLAYRRRGRGVQRLTANLRQVVGSQLPPSELDVLVRDAMRSYARYWLETFRLPSRSPAQIRQGFRLAGAQLLGEAVATGTGAVVALPHAGNWDAAGAWAAAQGWPVTTVAERLRPERLYAKFLAFREGLGMKIIPLHGGARAPLEVLEERLRQGHLVPLLADRDLSARGVKVSFFGATTRMPAGPAILALRTGAPLFVVSMWYETDTACGKLHGPMPMPPADLPLDQRVHTVTQQIADQLAAGIAAHPTDWHMLARMWLSTDEPANQNQV